MSQHTPWSQEEAEKVRARIMSKAKESSAGCWEWQGAISGNGYGSMRFQGKPSVAHRVSFFVFTGVDPSGSLCCHTCDNRKCVNPAHIFLGSHRDNMQDALAKGRNPFRNRTHCRNGHEFSGENLYITPRGERRCRTCTVASGKKYLKDPKNRRRQAEYSLARYYAARPIEKGNEK